MPLVEALLEQPGAADAAATIRLSRRMAARYRAWGEDFNLAEIVQDLTAFTGLHAADPLRACIVGITNALAAWGGPAYHSARHHAEVATSALVLAALGQHTRDQLGLLLCAALAHDLRVDEAPPDAPRFAPEAHSAAALDAIARACGVGRPQRTQMRLLILATEPAARAGLRTLLRQAKPHPDPELAPLATQPDLARLAALLSDADLLGSSGLTMAWHRVQEARLAAEWHRRLTRNDRLTFFRDILGPDYLSPGGGAFMANMRRVRAATLPGHGFSV